MKSLSEWMRNFFSGTRLVYKLTWIVLVFLIPIAVLTWVVTSLSNEHIDFARSELRGVDYLQTTRQLLQAESEHRRAAFDAINAPSGDTQRRRRDLEERVDQAIARVLEADAKIGQNDHTKPEVKAIQDRWAQIKAVLAGRSVDDDELKGLTKSRQLLELHGLMMTATCNLMVEVADVTKLTLDPEYATYGAQSWMLQAALSAQRCGHGQLIGLEVALSAEKKITLKQDRELHVLVGQLGETGSALESAAEDFEKEASKHYASVKNEFEGHNKAREDFLKCLTKQLTGEEPFEVNHIENEGENAVKSAFGLYDKTEPVLRMLLEERIGRYRKDIYVSLAAVIGGLVVVFVIVYFVVRSITRQAGSMLSTFSQIGIGNFEARATVTSNDEVGTIATNMNSMLDNTLALIQSREERDNIQTSIMKLLEEVAGVADGDLTKEAEVTADVTGAIADSFNFMIDQLRKIIGNVQKATKQVSHTAQEVSSSAQHLASGSEQQAMQIVNTSAAVDEMAVSIQQVSENASTSAAVAQQALNNARVGNEAVKNTIAGMDRIRDQVQETAKRIKRLGESSQEIGQIIQLIDDIADRTSILALNASIQAAMAGEAGRGFAVVAEEVERLAERSTDATKKIATLIKTIQTETNEAVGAMEKGIHEVVEGSKLATSAGQSLVEIESVSNRLSDLIQSISLASKQQARASEGVAKSMSEISEVTQQTAAGTKQASVAVNALAGLAEGLRSSVSQFKLPDSEEDEPVSHRTQPAIDLNGHANGNGHSPRHREKQEARF